MKSRAIAIKYKKYLIANTKNRKSKLRMNHPIGALPLVYFLHPEPLEKKIVPLLAPKFSCYYNIDKKFAIRASTNKLPECGLFKLVLCSEILFYSDLKTSLIFLIFLLLFLLFEKA